MNLPDNERKQFFKLYNSLLVYINNKNGILDRLHSCADLSDEDPEDIERLKENLYSDPDLIDCYVQENPRGFSSEELQIISSWRHFIKGRFYIVRYLKRHAVFLDDSSPPKAYGVKGLAMQWNLIANLPRIVQATLIPFKDKIIFDGSFSCYNLFLSPEMKRSILESFCRAQADGGIITSLPASEELGKPDKSEKLREFVRSQDSRERHKQEIGEMIRDNPELLAIYSEEMGKVHARKYRKKLRVIGVKEGWFATIDGIIIAGGSGREEVERAIEDLLPPEKKEFAYIFHLK